MGIKQTDRQRQTPRHQTPSWEPGATVYRYSERGGKKWGQRGKNEGGETQISTNVSLGADLETGGHNEGGGNILEALSHTEVRASRE